MLLRLNDIIVRKSGQMYQPVTIHTAVSTFHTDEYISVLRKKKGHLNGV